MFCQCLKSVEAFTGEKKDEWNKFPMLMFESTSAENETNDFTREFGTSKGKLIIHEQLSFMIRFVL